jgi:AcrR family transcriptional regulator
MATTDLSGKSEKRQRVPAAERRDALIDAAIEAFAHGGLHGTPVADIARRVGVAQPYVFSLFPTKRDLFLAAVDRGFDTVIELFRQVAAEFRPDPGDPDHILKAALGDAYIELLGTNRALLMLQLHAYAACGDDDEIRTHVRADYARLEDTLREIAEMDEATLNDFLSVGMWLTVQAAMQTGDLTALCDWIMEKRAAQAGS